MTQKFRKVHAVNCVRRFSTDDGRMINLYDTEQKAQDMAFLLGELGQLERRDDLGRAPQFDEDGLWAVAS